MADMTDTARDTIETVSQDDQQPSPAPWTDTPALMNSSDRFVRDGDGAIVGMLFDAFGPGRLPIGANARLVTGAHPVRRAAQDLVRAWDAWLASEQQPAGTITRTAFRLLDTPLPTAVEALRTALAGVGPFLPPDTPDLGVQDDPEPPDGGCE